MKLLFSKSHIFLSVLTALFMSISPGLTNICNAKQQYVLSRAPQRSTLETYKAWKPFVDYLSQETGEDIKLKVYKKRKDFESDLLTGNMDLVYMNPFYYHLAHKRHGFVPLIRSGSKKLQGILVARKDSGIHSVKDLDNKLLVFPSPNSFAASLVMRALLLEKENITFRTQYVETHDNVYRHVLIKHASAGGGIQRTLDSEPPELRQQFKIIYKTDPLIPHPIASNPRVPKAVQMKITAAVIKLTKSKSGQKILKAIKIPGPIQADHKRDYGILKKLNISKYATLR